MRVCSFVEPKVLGRGRNSSRKTGTRKREAKDQKLDEGAESLQRERALIHAVFLTRRGGRDTFAGGVCDLSPPGALSSVVAPCKVSPNKAIPILERFNERPHVFLDSTRADEIGVGSGLDF